MAEYALDEVDYEEWEADGLDDLPLPEEEPVPSGAAEAETAPEKAPEPAQPADSFAQPSAAVAQVKQEPAPATVPALQAVKEEPKAEPRTNSRAAVSATGDAGRAAIPAPKPRQPSRSAAVEARPQANRRGGQGQAAGHNEAMARRHHSPVIFPPPGLQQQQQQHQHNQQQQQRQQHQQQRGLGNGMPGQGLGNGMFQPMPFGRMPQHQGHLLMESLPRQHPGARPALPMPQQPGGFGGQAQRPSLPMPPGQQRRAEQRARLQDPEGKAAHKEASGVFSRLGKPPSRGTADMSPEWQSRQSSPERHHRTPGEPYLMDDDGPPAEPGRGERLPMRPAQTGSLPRAIPGAAQRQPSHAGQPLQSAPTRPPVPGPGQMWRPGSMPNGERPQAPSPDTVDLEKQLKLEHIKLQIERQKLENQIIRDYDKRRQQQEADQVKQSMADLARLLQMKEQELAARRAAQAVATPAPAQVAPAAAPAVRQASRTISTPQAIQASAAEEFEEEDDDQEDPDDSPSPPVPAKRGRSSSQAASEAVAPAPKESKRRRHSPTSGSQEQAPVVTDLRELLSGRRSRGSGGAGDGERQADRPARQHEHRSSRHRT